MRTAWLALLVAAGCVRTSAVDCGDAVCASGQICVHATAAVTVCAPPGARDACAGAGIADGQTCDDARGRCYDGTCVPIMCGDRLVDPADEQCDDGNNIPGDQCSADCRSTEQCGNGVVDPIRGEICDDGNLVGHDGCTGACTIETPRWSRVVIGTPPSDAQLGMAYLPARGRVVGVFEDTDFTMKTWEWNGTGWQRLATPLAPQPRQHFSTVADTRRDVLAIIGGASGGPSNPDLWELVGDRWTLGSSTVVPRFGAAVAYDPRRERIVVFGGRDDRGIASILLDDMYEWDGATAAPVTPSGQAPSARFGAAMIYDPRRDELVLFGGQDMSKPQDDTWTYKAGAWTHHAVPGPSARAYARMVVDRTGVLLYGGTDGAGSTSDAWRWDGAAWASLGAQTAGKHAEMGLAYDAGRDRVVLYGDDPIPTTWEWDGTAWKRIDTVVPAIGEFAAAVFDPLRHQGIVTTPSQTYAMRDGSWKNLAPGPSPNRSNPAVTFDSARDRAVMFGGVSNAGPPLDETMVLSPGAASPQWTPLGATPRPPARSAAAMAFDSDRGISVLFGGNNGLAALGDTWELDTAWHERSLSPAPSARAGHAIAYDPVRKQTILFGGTDFVEQYADTWAWNGTAWAELHPTGRIPAARMDATLTWNPARRRLTLIGGRANTLGVIDDAWEWTGDHWSEIKPASTPGARAAHVAVPASDASGLFVVAGGNGNGPLADEWLLAWSETDRVYERCVVDADVDGDGARGCDDPDCWWACTPLCTPTVPCAPAAPRCGDHAVAPAETCALCSEDVPACPMCGDLSCEPPETTASCPGDCP